MRSTTTTIVTISALLAPVLLGAVPAAADHAGTCQPESSVPLVEEDGLAIFQLRTVVGVSPPRVDPQPGAPTGVVVYEESNGLEGIQRGDTIETDYSCGHGSDTMLGGAGCAQRLIIDTRFWPSPDYEFQGCELGSDLAG